VQLDFQRAYWESRLLWPDWYVRLEDELEQLFFPVVHNSPQLKSFRRKVYDLIAELLQNNRLPLAQNGQNLDLERKAVDTIVIHHTEEEPGLPLDTLSAIGLVRQYAFQYLADNVLGNSVRGWPIWSGHFRAGEMVFFAYHWLIRLDGTVERLLEDTYIGWHAGNWDINTRSVAIAFAGDYEEDSPPVAQIEAAAQVVKEHYSHVARARLLGHREVTRRISCPGATFLGTWKDMLLQKV
jgi:N-acetylmuramoyl-L-alanine amidase